MTARYKPYPEYKPSGVEWLGDVPAGWGLWKLAHAFSGIGSGTTPSSNDSSYYEGTIPWITTGELRERTILDTKKKLTVDALRDFSALKKFPAGSVAIAMYGATIGRLGVFGIEATTNQACCVLPRSRVLDNRYVFYWLQSFREKIIQLSVGGGQPNINQEIVASLKVSAPNKTGQEAIVLFLDRETGKIDRLVEKQERMMVLLKEKRQAVISHAVAVHKNDKQAKLSFFTNLLPGYAFKSDAFTTESTATKLLRGINVGVGRTKWDESVYFEDDATVNAFRLKVGDLVVGMDRPWIKEGARVAQITDEDLPCLLVQRVARLRAINGLQQDYLRIQLQSKRFQNYVESDLTGVSVPHLSPDQILEFRIPVLSLAKQVERVAMVQRMEEKFHKLSAKAEQAIALMKERRTALISAAVTGKIDVRGFQGLENNLVGETV